MTEQDVIAAFLAGAKAEESPLRSDGARFYVRGDLIAEWAAGRLIVEPRRQSPESERAKDLLTHSVLSRMCRNQEVRRLLHRSCRDLLRSAMSAGRPGRMTAPAARPPSRAEP